MYTIEYAADSVQDLARLRAYDRNRILDRIELQLQERVLLTRNGQPIALLIGLDEEQQQLGRSSKFWSLISERRRQPTISRAELDRRLDALETADPEQP